MGTGYSRLAGRRMPESGTTSPKQSTQTSAGSSPVLPSGGMALKDDTGTGMPHAGHIVYSSQSTTPPYLGLYSSGSVVGLADNGAQDVAHDAATVLLAGHRPSVS